MTRLRRKDAEGIPVKSPDTAVRPPNRNPDHDPAKPETETCRM